MTDRDPTGHDTGHDTENGTDDAPLTVYVRDESALWRRMFNGVVVLGSAADQPISISHPGLLIWQLLAQPTTLAALADTLSAEFEVAPERVRADALTVIEVLVAAGAVTTRPH